VSCGQNLGVDRAMSSAATRSLGTQIGDAMCQLRCRNYILK